jgi:acyl-CoA synthetase (AMP-forming)/AMP-acid ligase II
MAESTVMITHARHASPVMETFCASGLSRGDVIVEVETSDDRDRSRDITLIGNGCVGDQHAMKIVDPNTRELLDTNKVGEIWVHGPSIGMGYWGNLEASDATFNGRTVPDDGLRYLRTGDLGFVRNGELFVVGRQKEILILNGRNFYPHDVEEIVRNVDPSFRSGMIAVFEDHRDGRAGLGILIEIKLRRDTDIESMLRRMRSAVSNALDVDVHTAGFVSPFALPRTTSGKLRRLQCRELVKSGDLEITSGLEAVS